MNSPSTYALRPWPRLSRVVVAVIAAVALLPILECDSAEAATTLFPSGKDDTARIQQRLNTATPSNPVRLGAGTFRISKPLVVKKSGTKLLGAGKTRTILRSTRTAANGDPIEAISVFNVNNVEVGALGIDGTASRRVTDGIKAYISTGDNFHDVGVVGATSSGVLLWTASKATVTRSTFANIGLGQPGSAGVYVWYSSVGVKITDNTVVGTASNGIAASLGSSGLTVARNTISGVGGVGLDIELWHDCNSSVVEDNRVEHWISIAKDDNVAVRRNTIANTGTNASFAGIEYASGTDTVISDNVITAPTLHGIAIPTGGEGATTNLALLRNTIANSQGVGVLLRGGPDGLRNLYMGGGVVAGTANPEPDTGDGIRIDNNARYLTFDKVAVSNNAVDGFQVFGDYGSVDNVAVISSQITGNQGDAVGPWTGYANLVWAGNTVAGNGSDAVPPTANTTDVGRPVPSFTMPGTARVGQKLTIANRSTAASGAVGRVLWDLGTGAPSTAWAPTVSYARRGTYTVTVTVWDDAGRASSLTKKVVVR